MRTTGKFVIGCLLFVATLLACAPASTDAGPRAPIPNSDASVVVPAQWEVPTTLMSTTGRSLTLTPIRPPGSTSWPMYPQLSIDELRPGTLPASLRGVAQERTRPRKGISYRGLRFERVAGVEIARYQVESPIIFDSVNGRGMTRLHRSTEVIAAVGQRYFECSLTRDAEDAPAATDASLVATACASIRTGGPMAGRVQVPTRGREH